MIVKECKSYYGKCPCMNCIKFCCVENEEMNTENLCEEAREYCESLHKVEVGESND